MVKILTKNGFQEFKGLHKVKKPGLKVLFENGQTFICSRTHRFISGDLEIFANSLRPGNIIEDVSGNLVKVVKVSRLKEVELIDVLGVDGATYTSEGFEHHNCEFLGSTYTLIEPDILKKLYEDLLKISPIKEDLGGHLRIYEYPDKKFRYVIGVDPSKGSGKHDATIQVLKVLSVKPELKARQVAVFSDNSTDPYAMAQVVNRLSIYYNSAQIFCEGNGEGSATVSHLWWTFQNPNVYNEIGKNVLGLVATPASKSKAVVMMKRLIENGFLELTDTPTLNQLATYIEDDSGKTHGQNGLPDDLVSSLYWACYGFSIPENWEDTVNVYKSEEEGTWGILTDIDDFHGAESDWFSSSNSGWSGGGY